MCQLQQTNSQVWPCSEKMTLFNCRTLSFTYLGNRLHKEHLLYMKICIIYYECTCMLKQFGREGHAYFWLNISVLFTIAHLVHILIWLYHDSIYFLFSKLRFSLSAWNDNRYDHLCITVRCQRCCQCVWWTQMSPRWYAWSLDSVMKRNGSSHNTAPMRNSFPSTVVCQMFCVL